MMRNSLATMLILAAGLVLTGCGNGDKGAADTTTTASTAGGSTGASASGGKTYKIYVIPKGSTHDYWKAVHAGANDAGKQFGAEITFKGPIKEDDRASQEDLVENVVASGTDGIVLAPLDNKALRKQVDEALAKKIPVVIIDSSLDGSGYASYVATDNEKGGQMAADEMIKELGGKGKVVMLRYAEGSASTDAREKGFEEELKAKGPGIQIVSDNQYGGATSESAQKASENLLAQFKGGDGKLTIDGIYTPNESTTFGMLLTLESNKWAGTVKFVGFDSSEKLVEGLTKGEINGLILQNPYKIGFEGVKAVVAAIKGEKVEPRIDTGATLITKENMGSEESKKLLNPPQA